MGESSAEKAGIKSSKEALANTREGIAGLEDVAAQFSGDPFLGKIREALGAYLENPFTYDQNLKDQIGSNNQAVISRNTNATQGQFGQGAERLGLGRSEAGGVGLSNLANLAGQSQTLNSLSGIERLAAESRIRELLQIPNAGFNFLNASLQPQRDVALGQLGTLAGLSGLTSANANLASQQSGPLDFLGGLVGTAAGAAAPFGFAKLFGFGG